MKPFAVLALAMVLLSWSAGAEAQEEPAPVAQQLEQLREMMLYARYREAIAGAQALLERSDLSADHRNAGLELLAMGQLVVNDRRGAQEALQLLYARDPEHRLLARDTGPAVIAAFDRARESRPTPIDVVLESEAPDRIEQRRAPVISVRATSGYDAIHELQLSYRQADMPAFQNMEMLASEDGTARARVPLLDGEEAYTVQWYVEAIAPSQTVIGRLGSADAPLTLEVPPAPPPEEQLQVLQMQTGGGRPADDEGAGVLGQWWFWTAVAVVVLGGAAAALYLSQPSQPDAGTLGEGTL